MALQNIIALCFDSDGTLNPGNMQEPIFRHFGVEPEKFWDEVEENRRKAKERGVNFQKTLAYLDHMIEMFGGPDFTNANLRKWGQEIEFFQGLPEFFPILKEQIEQDPRYKAHNIALEFYIITSGLAEMVKGSKIGSYIKQVYGCEFLEDEKGLIHKAAYPISDTEKTKFLFKISKGPKKRVNDEVPSWERRVGLQRMGHVGDSEYDLPTFSVLEDKGGFGIGVWDPSKEAEKRPYMERLYARGKVHGIGAAEYRPGSETFNNIKNATKGIAEDIVAKSL